MHVYYITKYTFLQPVGLYKIGQRLAPLPDLIKANTAFYLRMDDHSRMFMYATSRGNATMRCAKRPYCTLPLKLINVFIVVCF